MNVLDAPLLQPGMVARYPGGGEREIVGFGIVPESGIKAVRVRHPERVRHHSAGRHGGRKARTVPAWESWEPAWMVQRDVVVQKDGGS